MIDDSFPSTPIAYRRLARCSPNEGFNVATKKIANWTNFDLCAESNLVSNIFIRFWYKRLAFSEFAWGEIGADDGTGDGGFSRILADVDGVIV